MVEMPSKVFYDGDMLAARHDEEDSDVVRKVKTMFTNQRFGRTGDRVRLHNMRQVFFDVMSMAQRQPNGVSRSNPGGDDAIETFVHALIRAGVPPSSIGIITNYKYDMTVLLARFRSAQVDGVEVAYHAEVATVDAFQGRQKDIIILHFVVASENTNIRYPFGHVRDPRRLCVGLTRAREYQFMFGNATSWKGIRQTAGTTPTGTHEIYEVIDHVEESGEMKEWREVDLTYLPRIEYRADQEGTAEVDESGELA